MSATTDTAGIRLHSDGSGVYPYQVKNAVTLKFGNCAAIDANGQAKLPAGDDDVNAKYCVIDEAAMGDGLVGSDTDPVDASLAGSQPSVPFLSQAAIDAGKRVASKGTDGRVYQTSSAGFGTALNSVAGANETVYVQQD